MFKSAQEYMLQTRDERTAHLKLDEACIEIGGESGHFKGLLAHYLRTEMVFRRHKGALCHACSNPGCSNPRHLYWGTYRDNSLDFIALGKGYKGGHKHTEEQKRKMGSKSSAYNKGRPKSEAHKQALSEATKRFFEDPEKLKKQQEHLQIARSKRKYISLPK